MPRVADSNKPLRTGAKLEYGERWRDGPPVMRHEAPMLRVFRPAALGGGVCLLLLLGPAAAVDITLQNPAPANLYGTYAPGGDCSRQPQVSLDATGLYLSVNGGRGQVPDLDACFTCAGGYNYEGPTVWIGPEVNETFPVWFYFNESEVIGRLVVEDNREMPLGANLSAVVAGSPYQICTAPSDDDIPKG
jgi:hypothetical protein